VAASANGIGTNAKTTGSNAGKTEDQARNDGIQSLQKNRARNLPAIRSQGHAHSHLTRAATDDVPEQAIQPNQRKQ
jgi:hypothetical protein